MIAAEVDVREHRDLNVGELLVELKCCAFILLFPAALFNVEFCNNPKFFSSAYRNVAPNINPPCIFCGTDGLNANFDMV